MCDIFNLTLAADLEFHFSSQFAATETTTSHNNMHWIAAIYSFTFMKILILAWHWKFMLFGTTTEYILKKLAQILDIQMGSL